MNRTIDVKSSNHGKDGLLERAHVHESQAPCSFAVGRYNGLQQWHQLGDMLGNSLHVIEEEMPDTETQIIVLRQGCF